MTSLMIHQLTGTLINYTKVHSFSSSKKSNMTGLIRPHGNEVTKLTVTEGCNTDQMLF